MLFYSLGADVYQVCTWPPKEVLDEVCTAIRRFVWMKPSYYRAVALWIVLTYLHDAVDILPILLVTSPEEDCGKSTLLKLILYLSNRPIPASNISAAAIYRTIGDNHPTLILDEADTYLKEDEAMRGVINSGHERQLAYVIRVVNDKGETGQFSTWCPKAIAMIGQPKRTILSRSIPVRLERKPKGTKTEKLKSGHKLEFEDLRRKISRLANDFAKLREELGLEPGKRFFCKTLTLLSRLNDDSEAPWREHKDQLLTATRMGRELKEYDITSHEVQEGKDRGKGYWSDEVEAAVEKYKPEAGEKTAKTASRVYAPPFFIPF